MVFLCNRRLSPCAHALAGIAVALLVAVTLAPAQAATVTISIGGGYVLDDQGNRISTSSLFQLVDLGTNGVFDSIPAGSWTGGDDSVVAEAFPNSDGWSSAAAFDLTNGTGTAGQFSRQFTFTLDANIAPGEMLGLRWFPGVIAANYASTVTTAGLAYGQFTRQSNPLYGGTVWVVPSGGSLVTFDPLVTASYDPVNGKDSNSAGAASLKVVSVPEPAAGAIFTAGLFIITGLVRRRASQPRHFF
jgi:hypothetical protein